LNIFLKRRNLILVLAGGLAFLLVATIVFRYRSLGRVAERIENLPAEVELALQDIDYTHSEAGVVRWRLQAERAERSAGEGKVAVKNLILSFFGESGSRQFLLQADQGEADRDFQKIRASGEVVVKSARGYRLATEELVFSQSERKIRSGSPVMLEFDKTSIEGNALLLDLESQTLTVYNGVEAVLPMAGDRR